FYGYGAHRSPHSFPTRRSSDLEGAWPVAVEVTITSEIAEKLRALPDSSAVALHLKSDQYFDAIQGMLDRFAMKKDLEVVYVTSRSEEHTSELQSRFDLVCRLLL